MTDKFEAILDESISALQAGIPLEEILEEAPDYAAELRPLLYASILLTNPDPAPAPVEKKAALREEYIRQADELPTIPTPTIGEKTQAIISIIRRRLTRKAILADLVTIIVTVTLTLMMATLLLAFAATETIPGDFLYGVKRISENIRLSLTFDENNQVQLMENFNQRRLREIDQLITRNRAAVVQFRGVLEAKGENLWVIEGYTILLPDDLILAGDSPREGDRVEVIGLLRTNNVLVADTIKVVDRGK